jgi:sugar transferase (PEP-CTERM system associated)
MPYILKKYYPLRNLVFFFGEGVLIFSSLVGIYLLNDILWLTDFPVYPLILLRAAVVTLTFQLCLYLFDQYNLSSIPSFSDAATSITQAFGIGCIVLAAIYYIFPSVIITSSIFWQGYAAICLNIALWRLIYVMALKRRLFVKPIILIGTGELAEKISNEIMTHLDCGYKIAAFFGKTSQKLTEVGAPFYLDKALLHQTCRQTLTEKIIVALDDQRGKLPIKDLLTCKLQGIEIDTGINFYESLTGKILVKKVNPSWLIYSEGFNKSRLLSFGKRVIDLTASIFGLLVASPIMLFSALFIKLESPGPVFYLQERVGEKGKIYKILKFRSMRRDAEKDGPVWAKPNDCRITRYGSLMRKGRIDEIPQMWNVLKGEMSFVGPRPERPVFVAQLEQKIPYYSLRHSVKPGITGWAQVCYPYGASEEDALRKLEFDLYYIKNLALGLDLWIIFQTIKTVLFQKGAR